MPYRLVAAKELAEFLGVLAHPARVRLIEELRGDERDVGALSAAIQISPSSTSQHLMVLRAHRIVAERRDGRHVLYHLRKAALADWLFQALDLLPQADKEIDNVRQAIRKVRAVRKLAKTKSSSESLLDRQSDS